MDLITKLRYKGYLATPPLWKDNDVSQYNQVILSDNSEIIDNSDKFKNKRLGKLVEEFVNHQIKQESAYTWICNNLQIQEGKQTVGEIDALYYFKDLPIHIEIVYKFYLYDTLKTYKSPLAYWIGPNRKDSLLYKLDKLHNKQLPLLHHKSTKAYLDNYNLKAKTIAQKLCFKAQLFLPHNNLSIDIKPLNPGCIIGYHITFNKIEVLKNYEFYFPEKLDWLVIPHLNVNWISYNLAIELIKNKINDRRSPLVWIKNNKDNLYKYFITFW
ncbi:DUF1853 family protein [Winogradskyella sp. PG-2]|uniref:DUF1853 family protein n=1 Tax=Winogradskyella sp. PG-2 TaxID=754409 RepID=UPI0004587E54|nr:DUF1853 family protein [Winogradskyella sp. PG-2]BAO77306.1 hypothetical protein WPG_3076 [Winogradskyella sp. PG-2]